MESMRPKCCPGGGLLATEFSKSRKGLHTFFLRSRRTICGNSQWGCQFIFLQLEWDERRFSIYGWRNDLEISSCQQKVYQNKRQVTWPWNWKYWSVKRTMFQAPARRADSSSRAYWVEDRKSRPPYSGICWDVKGDSLESVFLQFPILFYFYFSLSQRHIFMLEEIKY